MEKAETVKEDDKRIISVTDRHAETMHRFTRTKEDELIEEVKDWQRFIVDLVEMK